MELITILSFVFFTALVAVVTWWLTRNSDVESDEGYMGTVVASLVVIQLALSRLGFRQESIANRLEVHDQVEESTSLAT